MFLSESSPTRRRSADLTGLGTTEKKARLEVMRRKSIAVIESTTVTATGKLSAAAAIKSKTRLSLTLSGNGKAAAAAKEGKK